ncbi:MAG: hypothetical protein ACLU9S_05965 [Oscillospiraceae bacterium]
MPEFLTISRADMAARGWEQCDFVYIIGDVTSTTLLRPRHHQPGSGSRLQ